MSRNGYITGIDGIRAIAVLSVMIYHIDEYYLPGGFVGVDLFFVISGFVVSKATSNIYSQTLGQFVLAFYRRRVLRILPAALGFLLTAQLATVLFIPVRDRLTVPDMTASAATVGFSNIILWLKAGDYFSPGVTLNPFTHTWSLAVEEQFYILFPLFALFIFAIDNNSYKRRHLATAGVCGCTVISLIIAIRLTKIDNSFAFYMLPARFWELAAGVLLFVAIERDGSSGASIKHSKGLVAGLSICGAATLIASLGLTKPDIFPFPGAITPVLSGVLLIYVVSTQPNSHLSLALSTPVLRYFGRISYSLYLWHWAVIVLMRWTSGLDTVIEKGIAILFSIILAELSYNLLEKPIRSSRWITKKSDRQVIVVGIAGIVICSMSIGSLTILRPSLTLSTTGNLDVWLPSQPGVGGQCNLERGRHSFGTGGTRYVFEPISCQGAVNSRHLYVVGDSHAWAYQRLIGNIARAEGLAATIYTKTGCAVVPISTAKTALSTAAQTAPDHCATFVDSSLSIVSDSAKPGDILFLPGLRVQRYQELGDTDLRTHLHPVVYTASMVYREAIRLKKFIDKGVRVILEAPKPVYKYAPMRCFDWFNKHNSYCQEKPVLAEELQHQRIQVLELFEKIRKIEPQIEVWDPFLLLCPGTICSAVRDGKPIVSDGDHLSGYANDYLSPFFISFLNHHNVNINR